MELIKFILLYTFLLVSLIGYGLLFSEKFTRYNKFSYNHLSLGYIGIFGIFFLIFISYLTNLFVPHNNLHNVLVIIVGIILFSYFYIKSKKKFVNKYFLFAYIISFFSIFYFKSHDDFSYYHLSFIENLTENKIEFGINKFDIAFNHVSSLFYFHSLFKTFLTDSFFYQIGQLSIVIFVNTILFEKIFLNKKNSFLNISFFLNIFFLIFVNIFFYRLAEHGTDRSAQILFFLTIALSLVVLEKKILEKNIFELLIIIFTLIVTLKSFYILYSILLIFLYLKFFKIYELKKMINAFPIIYLCLLVFLLMLVHNVASSGCLVYPVAITCPESFFWGYGKKNVLEAMEWYEVWSKAGASPIYRVENFSEYINNFNWISNWTKNYFFNKMSDYLFGVIFAIAVVIIFFKFKNFSLKNSKKYISIYLILLILLIEWFANHPSLRYGGYVLIYLILILPFSALLENQKYKFKNKINSIKIIFCLVIIIFASRNINRLIDEFNIYNYNFLKNPYYNVKENYFTMQIRKKNSFYDLSKCENKNSKENILCKKKISYNFYYKIQN